MNFSQKLRTLRKQFALSQEQLAEKLGVSRQAVTKWETDGGLPDIENLMAIAALFSISLDELLSGEKLACATPDYAYESVTEYDIDRANHFDIRTPGALEVSVTATEDEKLRVRLASNVLSSLAQDYKIKLDEHRTRLDVNIRREGEGSGAEGKEALAIHISVPARYCNDVELSAVADVLRLSGLACPFELDGKARSVYMQDVKGIVALNCNSDMLIYADGLPAAIEVNQINATSVVHVPVDAKYVTKTKGKSNRIRYAAGGKMIEDLSDADAENRIELAGMNAELLIRHGGQ